MKFLRNLHNGPRNILLDFCKVLVSRGIFTFDLPKIDGGLIINKPTMLCNLLFPCILDERGNSQPMGE